MDPQQLCFAVLEMPLGTGKTMIAEALARSAGWHLVSATMGDWFDNSDGHLGGVKAIVSFFGTLLETNNGVGFIDELDGLPDRATLDARDRQWWTAAASPNRFESVESAASMLGYLSSCTTQKSVPRWLSTIASNALKIARVVTTWLNGYVWRD